MVLFTVLMGLIKLQDKHRFTPHGIVPLLSPRIDKEIALRLYKRSLKLDALRVQINLFSMVKMFAFFSCCNRKVFLLIEE